MNPDAPYCACATPPGASGLSLIRMSGNGAAQVIDKVFHILRTVDKEINSVSEMKGYMAAFGRIVDPESNAVIDEVICTRFTPPHSYTGEDTIEISCHGGETVRQEILRVLFENGARPAEPGEFTKQAFLAGKIDLSQAEAVMDVISAKSELALQAAQNQLLGGIRKEIKKISEALYEQYSRLEMLVEFPEYEDGNQDVLQIAKALEIEYENLKAILETFSRGKILRDGMTVVLAGAPNSGKSSLLNRLAGYDRAIVTPIAGTTRDTLEIFVSLAGIPLRVIDTAGIRVTGDEVEKMGVDRAMEALESSDILLWLVDENGYDLHPDSSFFQILYQQRGNREVGIILSKSDTRNEKEQEALQRRTENFLRDIDLLKNVFFLSPFSSVTGEGMEELQKKVVQIYESKGQSSSHIITSSRHEQAVRKACEILAESTQIIKSGFSADMVCSLLHTVMDFLGEITGETVSDELVQQIFSRFCIGK